MFAEEVLFWEPVGAPGFAFLMFCYGLSNIDFGEQMLNFACMMNQFINTEVFHAIGKGG